MAGRMRLGASEVDGPLMCRCRVWETVLDGLDWLGQAIGREVREWWLSLTLEMEYVA